MSTRESTMAQGKKAGTKKTSTGARAARPARRATSRAADSRFQQMVDAAPNAMLVVRRDGIITFANAQAERLFGYRREELCDSSVDTLVPERFRAKHPSHRAAFFQ